MTTLANPPVTSLPKYANLEPVEDDDFPAPKILSIAQAARLCDRMHNAFIVANALPDLEIDYRGLINESVRAQWPKSAVTKGIPRGSRKYGLIPSYREPRGGNCRIWFYENEVIEWYEAQVMPKLSLKSTHATH
jgi:hypothetical protein